MEKSVNFTPGGIAPRHHRAPRDDLRSVTAEQGKALFENFCLPIFQRFRLQGVLVVGTAPHDRPETGVAPDGGGLLKGVPHGVGKFVIVIDIQRHKGVVPHMGAVIDRVPVGGGAVTLVLGGKV